MSNMFKLVLMFALLQQASFFVLNLCIGDKDLKRPHMKTIPEVGKDTIELIKFFGYNVEKHGNIETPDGYLLEMHRIPSGKDNKDETNKPAVLVMHGFLSSSADWVNMGPGISIAYFLADAGYDVWLGNARGNTYSRKHVRLDPSVDGKYWDFSWHEIGIYDLTTKIDYILSKTNQKSLYYIGHSQGTTVFFAMAAERPEYNKKIRYMAALAPVAFLSNIPNLSVKMASHFALPLLAKLPNMIGLHEFVPNCKYLQILAKYLCRDGALTQPFCTNQLFFYSGYGSNQLNNTRLPVIFTNVPAGVATKQGLHFLQETASGCFCKYDYGHVKNLKIYGQETPPNYNLSAVTATVGIYYSANDRITASADIDKLAAKLPNLAQTYLVPSPVFNHIDFMWGTDVVQLLYNTMLEDMQQAEAAKRKL